MSREEFSEFIKSFNKNPGEYTRDELYEIGLAHKKLEQKDKSWATLAQIVGWPGAAESYRHFVSRRSKENLEDIEEVADTSYDEAMRNLYVEKTKVRDLNNDYRRNMREEARIEALMEEIKNAAKELPSLPKVQPVLKSVNTKIEAVLAFSDLHLGPDFENSYNSYSYEIAVKRVNKLVADVIEYCRLHNVTRLNFLNLGDLIAGLIHPTIRLEQRLDITEQIMRAAELTAEALNQLQAAAPEIVYRSVVDNHSRPMPNKNEHIEKENFNKLIDWFVEERLKDTDIIFAHDNIDDGIGKFSLLNGKIVMFAHGHQDSADRCFQNFFGATREFIDYIILAHYHNSKEKTFNGMKVYVNGSIIGTDPYAYGKRLFSDPEQKLLVFEGNNIVDININLK